MAMISEGALAGGISGSKRFEGGGFSFDFFLRLAVIAVGLAVVFKDGKKEKNGSELGNLDEDKYRKWMHYETSVMIARFKSRVDGRHFEQGRSNALQVQPLNFEMFTREAREDMRNYKQLGSDSARELILAYGELEWVLIFLTQKKMAVRNFITSGKSAFTLPWAIFRAFDLQRFLLTVHKDQPLKAKCPTEEWDNRMAAWAMEIRTLAIRMFDEYVDPAKTAVRGFREGVEEGELKNPLVAKLNKIPQDSILLPIGGNFEQSMFMVDTTVAATYEEAWAELRKTLHAFAKEAADESRKLDKLSSKEETLLKSSTPFEKARDVSTFEKAFGAMRRIAKAVREGDKKTYSSEFEALQGNPLEREVKSALGTIL